MYTAFFLFAVGASGTAWAFERQALPEDLEPKRVYSPYAGRAYPDQVLFGKLHFHTNLSVDAARHDAFGARSQSGLASPR